MSSNNIFRSNTVLFDTFADAVLGVFAAPAAPTVSLLVDSGSDNTDLLTNDGRLAITAVAGATVEFSFDGLNWSTTPPSGMPDGRYTIQVRQIVTTSGVDETSAVTSITFTLDTTPPTALVLALENDTGTSSSDGITTDFTLTVTGQETDATIEFSIDGGVTWSATAPDNLTVGDYTVLVRQTDTAGNISAPAELRFTVAVEPAALVLTLDNDSGQSDTDSITNDAAITVTGLVTGGTITYYIDGDTVGVSDLPASWTEGDHTIIARQADNAGESEESTFTFTFDSVAPDVLEIVLQNDDGSSSSDNVTSDETLDITGAETGALIEYSLDGGTTWSNTAPSDLADGTYIIDVRQTDVAGNISDISSLTFTLTGGGTTPDPNPHLNGTGCTSDGPGGLGGGSDFGW